jgi:uncharacterized protein (DUF983 family)
LLQTTGQCSGLVPSRLHPDKTGNSFDSHASSTYANVAALVGQVSKPLKINAMKERNMKTFLCPHCGQKSVSIWQKVFPAPLFDTRCRECDAELWMRTPLYLRAMILIFILVLIALKWSGNMSSDTQSWLVMTFLLICALAQPLVSSIVARGGKSIDQKKSQ